MKNFHDFGVCDEEPNVVEGKIGRIWKTNQTEENSVHSIVIETLRVFDETYNSKIASIKGFVSGENA